MSNDKPRCVYAFGFCGEGRSRLLDWFGRAIAIHSILGVISCAPCITASTSICSGLM
ncbi:hypothetical protein [Nostoc sp.]|uniref:hypothetical protein n=1 Tax=Nostoc sp. TaxID=1180 RepID=UPI002FF95B55